MPKAKTPSFVLELTLQVKPEQERILLARLEAGKRLYNAVLGVALKRLNLMRQSKDYQTARKLKHKTEKHQAFKDCEIGFGFTEYALHDVVKTFRANGGFKSRISAQEAQKVATRAYNAVSEYRFGIRGKPRFKGIHRPLHSLEGKQNTTGIRFIKEMGIVQWSGLTLPVKSRPSQYIEKALQPRTKFCRIVWRTVKGQQRWFVQLIQEGKAPARYVFYNAGLSVGLDVGPSSIAVYSETAVGLKQFAPSVDQPWQQIKLIQRAMDRSRRATNPQNYNANGTVKKGVKTWIESSRYKQLKSQLAELERKLATGRKSDHGCLANKIVGLGNSIQSEKLSYKAFQKLFGRSVKQRAPGLFIELLNRKAESADGRLADLNTWDLKMSQYDHVNDSYTKKPLSQRYHRLSDGTVDVQRDMYSAFLACYAQENKHDPSQLEQSWATAEALLSRAGLCVEQSVRGKAPAFSTVAIPLERIARERVLK